MIPALYITAGIAAAIMWKIKFHWEKSVFTQLKGNRYIWFSPVGWHLKYKNSNPEEGPAFFGSTTVFVWLTDAFHFFQMVMFTCLEVAAVLSGIDLGFSSYLPPHWPAWLDFALTVVIIKTFRGLSFELIFTYLLDMNFWNNLRSTYLRRFADSPRITSILTVLLGGIALFGLALLPEPWNLWTVVIVLGIALVFVVFILIRSFLRDASSQHTAIEEEESESS